MHDAASVQQVHGHTAAGISAFIIIHKENGDVPELDMLGSLCWSSHKPTQALSDCQAQAAAEGFGGGQTVCPPSAISCASTFLRLSALALKHRIARLQVLTGTKRARRQVETWYGGIPQTPAEQRAKKEAKRASDLAAIEHARGAWMARQAADTTQEWMSPPGPDQSWADPNNPWGPRRSRFAPAR